MRRHFSVTYVRNKASRIETREIVLSPPAGKRTLSACHALQSARIAPRPGPTCPPGLHFPEHWMFCRRVLCTKRKVGKSTKILQSYVYIYHLSLYIYVRVKKRVSSTERPNNDAKCEGLVTYRATGVKDRSTTLPKVILIILNHHYSCICRKQRLRCLQS